MSKPLLPWDCPPFDWESALRAYGSPLYVFFPQVLQRNMRSFEEALRCRYAKHVLSYSVKTNYLPYAVRRAAEFGAVPEVVSGFEVDLVERLGLLGPDTVVNGPLKTGEELRKVVPHRCRINVDNPTELAVLEGIGVECDRRIAIGLRVSSHLGQAPWERFGFHPAGVRDAARRIREEMPHLRLTGLHFHGGSNIPDPGFYREASGLVCGLADRLAREGLIELDYLDFGGGYATDCPRKDREEWAIPPVEEYVDALVSPLREILPGAEPTLIVEPGRFLVDDAFILLTTVERLRDGDRPEVIVDAGVNLLPSARWRRHRVACLSRSKGATRDYSLFGPLCLPFDCLAEAAPLPSLSPGDVLAVAYAGAYSISQSWVFIKLQPAVVAIEDDGPVLVRRRQTIDDFLCRDVM